MSSAPRNESAGALKTCPHCAEKVKLQASLCKYCGQPLEVHSREVKNDWE
ncbi:zinc ribbon domain-containing protein, partial [Pseudomonas lundensis]